MDDYLYDRLATPRLTAIATAAIAGAGVVLAAIGCFALFASIVKNGLREIAIRRTLGARAAWLYRRCLLQAATLAGAGIVLGLAATVWIRQEIADQLYGNSLRDLRPFVAAAIVLLAVAMAASYWPARRASRLDLAGLIKGD
jgi:ABC-type antimicrobial peptide transport system permease subunit